MKGVFTPSDGSPPIYLGYLNHSVDSVARRTRSASRQQTTSSERRQASLRCQFTSGKCTSSPVQKTASDDEHSHDPEYSATRKILSRPSPSNRSPSSCLLSGYSTPPGELIRIVSETETPTNQDALPNTLLPGNKRQKTNPTKAFKGNNDSSNNVIQTSQGPSRKAIEEQLRHLRLEGQKIEKDLEHEESKLKRLKEARSDVEKKCDANSQLFGSIKAELQSKLNEGCSQHDSFEERNDIKHSKMKADLENVQSCKSRMAEVESEYAKHVQEKDALEKQVVQTRSSWIQMQSLLQENHEAIGVLEGERRHLCLEARKIEKDMECSIVEKACDDDEQLYGSIKAELLSKLIN